MDIWTNNDLYLTEGLIEEDVALEHALTQSRNLNLPDMEISPTQGKLLYMLAKIKNAKRILELGTFCGYSTIWLGKAIPDDGIVVSIEYEAIYAELACKNINYAGLSSKVNVLNGDASDLLQQLIAEKEEPFDMIFIDADKPNYSKYLELSLQLSKSGTVIYGDNVIRDGELCNKNSSDPKVIGVQQFIEKLSNTKAIESTSLQTVGIKGYDGFTLSIVK